MSESPGVRADVMVVDDTPANLAILEQMLSGEGYGVRPFLRGSQALAAAAAEPPDIILLDVNMPEMDGYEVCARLKADPRLADIPVLFVSALGEVWDKVRAFEAGGVDYVTKPFAFDELRARVAVQVQLRQAQRQLIERHGQLAASYEQLERLEAMRDGLVHMIVHDLRSPLTGLQSFCDLLTHGLAGTTPELHEYAQLAAEATARMLKLVNSLLDVHRLEAGELRPELAPCDLRELGEQVLRDAELAREQRRFELSAPPEPLLALVDAGLLRRVLGNLVDNAIKFTDAGDGLVRLTLARTDGGVRLEVSDNGSGIPPEYQERVFDKFGQVGTQAAETAPRPSTGLGLAFCKLAVEAHGGRIGVTSDLCAGTTFWLVLPQPES
jgi:signal transduction histidine kinase